MFDKSIKQYNTLLCAKITDVLGCTVVKSNITKDIPAYPFVSFTVLNIHTKKGTYGNDGETKFSQASMTYSWTVQAADDYRALELAQQLHDWFEETGRLWLKDNGMTFTGVGDITERDNMITVEYEHRKGFDCVMNVLNKVEQSSEVIETFEPKYE